jgi:hypothetical protein
MPIPKLNEQGFLPAGVWDCTMAEIQRRFGSFQKTDRRVQLFEKLESFIGEARQTGMIKAIIVNGSFISAKPDPNDIDLILVLEKGHDFEKELRPMDYNVLSRKRVRRRYGFDMFVDEEDSDFYEEDVRFFQKVRGGSGLTKGVLRIVL